MRKYVCIFLSVLLCSMVFSGCQKVDYSEYPFTEVSWTRETEQDTETIFFGADGSFRYSCSCGNSVNDADLCEGYTYDDETKTITLNYIETTEETVTVIKIMECSQDLLSLDFGGETRIFSK